MNLRKRRTLIAISIAIIACLFGAWTLLARMNKLAQYDERQRALYGRFDASSPGRGVLDYPGNPVGDVAKSYAMVLLGELQRAKAGDLPELPSLIDTAGAWLLDHPSTDDGGNVGWGLPVSWDAYGDGSENPENTIYSISTAIAVDALLTWSEMRTDAPQQRIFELVAKALGDFVAAPATPDGLFPYSLQANDQPYDTFNSAAYLAGQMQRFGELTGDGRYQVAADRTMESLVRNHRLSVQGHWYWTYSLQEARSNDLPHASYILKGILDYMRHGGALADRFDLPAIQGLLLEYLEEVPSGGTSIRAWPGFEADVTLPARSYDIGIALSIACGAQDLSRLRDSLLGIVDQYKTEQGFLKYPAGTPDMAPLIVNEYEAYLWYGLVTCASVL